MLLIFRVYEIGFFFSDEVPYYIEYSDELRYIVSYLHFQMLLLTA